MTHASLARKLRILRAARGITLAEAEELTGVTRETLGALEHGQRGAYTSTLEKIARGYGVTVSALLSEVEEPEAELALAGSSPGKVEAPREAGLAGADPSSKLIEAEVLKEIAELWAEQLARGFYDRRTLGMMHMAGGILAMNHDAALGEDRENLPPNFLAQLEAAEERFVAVGTQIWEAIEEADHGHPTLPDELAARRKAKSEAREALRQQLRGAAPVEAEAN
jgi:transcriptional regulator with XRE-family HTH domain